MLISWPYLGLLLLFWTSEYRLRRRSSRSCYACSSDLVIPFPWVKLIKLLGKIFVKLVPEMGLQWCHDTGCQLRFMKQKKRLCTTILTCSLFALIFRKLSGFYPRKNKNHLRSLYPKILSILLKEKALTNLNLLIRCRSMSCDLQYSTYL